MNRVDFEKEHKCDCTEALMDIKTKLINRQKQLMELEFKNPWDKADFDLAKELRKEINDINEQLNNL